MKNKILSCISFCLVLSLTGTACSMFRPVTEKELDISPVTVDTSPSLIPGTETKQTTQALLPVPQETSEQTAAIPETEPVPPEIRTVSFIGAGDNIVYYGNVRDAASCAINGGRTYNFMPTYSDVKSVIEEADIAFINQETLMCGDGFPFSYYPRFNGPQDLGHDLKEIGFNVINIANNHMLDKGAEGLNATMDFWNSLEGITLLGGYRNQKDYEAPRILEVNGVRIAFLSYTFMTNGLTLPASSEMVIPYPDDETVSAQLARSRELADYVLVSVHWGDENSFTPNEEQRSFASLLAEHGADAIIGHHPHVLQPIEWLERPDGKKTLCVYSLGNFMAEMSRDYNMLGGLISFDIVVCGDSVSTENVLFTPTVYYFTTSFYKNHIFPLEDFTDELAASHGLAYYKRSISIADIRNYLYSTISEEFLPSALQKKVQT